MIKGKGQRLIPEELLKKLLPYTEKGIGALVDSKGNSRFVEGEGVGLSQEGVNISYCKWSLSGTHLMLVCAGSVENTTVISSNVHLADFAVPNYIMDKIVPIFSTLVNRATATFYASNYSSQTLTVNLIKTTNINIQSGGSLTLSADRTFRIQFDLLIDSE